MASVAPGSRRDERLQGASFGRGVAAVACEPGASSRICAASSRRAGRAPSPRGPAPSRPGGDRPIEPRPSRRPGRRAAASEPAAELGLGPTEIARAGRQVGAGHRQGAVVLAGRPRRVAEPAEVELQREGLEVQPDVLAEHGEPGVDVAPRQRAPCRPRATRAAGRPRRSAPAAPARSGAGGAGPGTRARAGAGPPAAPARPRRSARAGSRPARIEGRRGPWGASGGTRAQASSAASNRPRAASHRPSW